jgi:predicted adenylyl cyclase CyaB
MPRNAEIKAILADPAGPMAWAAEHADSGPDILRQDDTFFPCGEGLLKLRRFPDGSGELIHYDRSETAGPKESRYRIFRTADASELEEVLAGSLGVAGKVRKKRTLYMVGRTRIHFDEVDGLGSFLELEVVLGEDEPISAGEAVARELMEILGVNTADLIDVPYVELLRRRKESTR